MREIPIRDGTIKLDSFLKYAGMVATGGQAKWLLRDRQVQVNGEVELRRGRKLRPGDVVRVQGVGSFRLERSEVMAGRGGAGGEVEPASQDPEGPGGL